MLRIGAHVRETDLLAEATARRADLVQTFFGDPQGWKAPVVPDGVPALTAAGVDLYVHAPYIVNVASTTTASGCRRARSSASTPPPQRPPARRA